MSDRETTRRPANGDETNDRISYGPNPHEQGKWVSGLIALAGLWMVIEVLVFDLVVAQLWSDIIAGALLVAVGGYNFSRQLSEEYGSVGAAGVAGLIGLWLVVSPFVFSGVIPTNTTGFDAAVWNDVLLGLLVLMLGAYSAYQIRDRRDTGATATA